MSARAIIIATELVVALLKEAGIEDAEFDLAGRQTREEAWGQRLYAFNVTWRGRKLRVDAPALSTDKMQTGVSRFLIDGSSWMWRYAVDAVRDFYGIGECEHDELVANEWLTESNVEHLAACFPCRDRLRSVLENAEQRAEQKEPTT